MTSWWVPAAVGGVLGLPYLLALRARPATLPRWRRWRTVVWLAGAALAALAVSPPLMALAQVDHHAHVAQHLVLGMYAPLGLVLAAPASLALGSLPRRAGRGLSRVLRSCAVHVLAHPVLAELLSVGSLFVLYLTPFYELTQRSSAAHVLLLAHLLLAGCLFTWAIAGPDPAPRRPRLGVRVLVLVAAAGAHAFLAKLLYAWAQGHSTHGHHGEAAPPGRGPAHVLRRRRGGNPARRHALRAAVPAQTRTVGRLVASLRA